MLRGKIFLGLHRSRGSWASLIRRITSRSVGENIKGISFCFSIPTPCSPVIVPPNSTQTSRMSCPACRTRLFPWGHVVEGDARVQIAITGMGQVGDTQAIAFSNGHDAAQCLGQLVRGTQPSTI